MTYLLLFLSLSVSANTNFEDLDAWKNVPVKALEQHPYWRNLYAIKATHPQGDEYRVLINRMVNPNIKSCHKAEEGLLYHSPECAKKDPCVMEFDGSYPSLLKYLDCSKNDHGCNNVFVIRSGMVSYFLPVGNCLSHRRLRPDPEIIKTMLR